MLNDGNCISNLYYDLNLSYNNKITDESVKCLTDLTKLWLILNDKINDVSVKCLINAEVIR